MATSVTPYETLVTLAALREDAAEWGQRFYNLSNEIGHKLEQLARLDELDDQHSDLFVEELHRDVDRLRERRPS